MPSKSVEIGSGEVDYAGRPSPARKVNVRRLGPRASSECLMELTRLVAVLLATHLNAMAAQRVAPSADSPVEQHTFSVGLQALPAGRAPEMTAVRFGWRIRVRQPPKGIPPALDREMQLPCFTPLWQSGARGR